MPAPLPLVLYPDARLKQPTLLVEPTTGVPGQQSLRVMAERMIATMHLNRGLGIAAPQVGWDRRVCIVSGTGSPGDEIVLVNPRIVRAVGSSVMEEGCLSFPGISASITRASEVSVEALDVDGKPFRLDAGGLLGRCVLHEVDHLDGVIFTSRFTPADRIRNRRALRELEENQSRVAGSRIASGRN